MNWRKGFFRIWIVLTILWILVIGAISWTDIPDKISLARLSDTQLFALFYPACRNASNPPPNDSVSVECLDAIKANSPTWDVSDMKRWGHGDSYIEQSMRVATALIPTLVLLLGPPLCFLLSGLLIGWALSGFKKGPIST
jgi:hypothetical protein